MHVLAHAVRKYSLKVVSLGPGGVIPHITALYPQGDTLPQRGGLLLAVFCGGIYAHHPRIGRLARVRCGRILLTISQSDTSPQTHRDVRVFGRRGRTA